MFDYIAKHQKLIQILLGVLGLTFAAWGIQSYTTFLRPSTDVATVNGVGISQKQFMHELHQQQARLQAMFGNSFNVNRADTLQARRALVESMVRRVLLIEQAAKHHITVSNGMLRSVIAAQPAFQQDGKFSDSRYRELLAAQGLSPTQFESEVRGELAVTELAQSISNTALVPRSVNVRLAVLEGEKREVSEALIPAKQFLVQVKVDPARVKAYYEAHQPQFRVPERVRAQYVVFSPRTLGKHIKVTDAELKAYYEGNQSEFRTPAERRASHILITVSPHATPAQEQAARAKAEKILAEVRKAPSTFAAMAKKYSQDPGSASKGGDLGYFERDSMVKPFADAVFGMHKIGQIVGPIKTQFGYHIIELTGIHPAKVRPFDKVRPQLIADVRKQRGLGEFDQLSGKFSNMVYEHSESLKPAAQQFHLQIQTTDWVERGANPELGELNNPKLVSALFSSDSLRHHRNTDAIEVANNVLVSARVVTHEAARERKFAEVKDQIEQQLRQEQAVRLARHEGEAKLAQLTNSNASAGTAGLQWSATKDVSRNDTQGLDASAVRRIMRVAAAKLPTYIGLEQGNTGFALYRITKVIPGQPGSKDQQAQRLARAQREAGGEQLLDYLTALRANGKVVIHEKNLKGG